MKTNTEKQIWAFTKAAYTCKSNAISEAIFRILDNLYTKGF